MDDISLSASNRLIQAVDRVSDCGFNEDDNPMPSGDLAIEVAVDRTQAAGLTVAAADGRVTFVALSEQ